MTAEFKNILSKLNIVYVTVPANCTDKLQPLNVAVNKPIKDEIRSRFQSWYVDEVREQLQTRLVHDVTEYVSASVVKTRSLGWFASSWQSLAARPTVAINGFKKASIYDAVTKFLMNSKPSVMFVLLRNTFHITCRCLSSQLFIIMMVCTVQYIIIHH